MNEVNYSSTFLGIKMSDRNVLIFIVLVTFVCLFPTLQNGWVNWDDDSYVLRNRLVHSLSREHLSAMFTTAHQLGLYHPLTLISFAIDYHFWGTDPFGFHLSNLALHLLNVCLVFFFLKKISSSQLIAFLVALLFGIHPMHVESVAWISGRKDVLYTLFYLLSLLSYLKYISQPEKQKYLWYSIAIIGFTCSLLSKSLAFTFPIILLLLDYLKKRSISPSTIIEKAPFFILAILALIMTKHGQEASNSMLGVTEYPLNKTVFIGTYNSIAYIFKAFIPVQLSIFHPFPFQGAIYLSLVYYLSAIPFVTVIIILIRTFNSSRKIFFGLAFFLITIGPVLQIIPFGKAISSERYTYISYIGLFYLIASGLEYLLKRVNKHRILHQGLIGLVSLWFLFLGLQANLQSKVWENSETLWTQTIERYPNSYWAYMCRGTYRTDNKNLDGALLDLNQSLQLNPTAKAYYERGRLNEKLGNRIQAIEDYSEAIHLDGNFPKSFLNRGILLAQEGEMKNALIDFNSALSIDNTYALAHFNKGLIYKLKGNNKKALNSFSNAIELEPTNPTFLRNRGVLYDALGNFDAAIADFERAMPLETSSGEPYLLRSISYFHKNEIEAALSDAEKASKLGTALPEEYLKKLRSAD